MGVQTAAAYLVSARFGNHSLAKACHHRSYEHDRTAQAGTPFQEFIALQIGKINIGCLKAICIDAFFRYVHSHIPHQLNQVVHIQDVRYVVHRHLFGCEQGGADNLQHLVLRSLRINVSGKAVSAFYYK